MMASLEPHMIVLIILQVLGYALIAIAVAYGALLRRRIGRLTPQRRWLWLLTATLLGLLWPLTLIGLGLQHLGCCSTIDAAADDDIEAQDQQPGEMLPLTPVSTARGLEIPEPPPTYTPL